MSHPRVISWLPIDTELIADAQSVEADANLVLNSSVPGLPKGAFIYDKVIRQVQLTSTGDESAVNFTITGIGSPVDANGNPTQVVSLISEVLTGPTAVLPTNSVNIYQQVISISADDDVTDISVGSGPNGITDFVFFDYNRLVCQGSISIEFIGQTTISATGYTSLNKPQEIDINQGNLISYPSTPFLIHEIIASTTTNVLTPLQLPLAVVWLSVDATSTDSLNLTVLQQGISQ